MIYDTTHKNPKIKEAINEEVGKSYSFFSRIRMNGIGSQRFIIEGDVVGLVVVDFGSVSLLAVFPD